MTSERTKQTTGGNQAPAITEAVKASVMKYLGKTESLPFWIINGDCESKNIRLVRIKDSIVEFEGRAYFPSWSTFNGRKKELPKDGLAYVYLFDKKLSGYSAFDAKLTKPLRDILGGDFYPTFYPQSYCVTDESYIPQISFLSVRPSGAYDNGIGLNYCQSGRSGLNIQSIGIIYPDKFFASIFGSVVIMTEEFKRYLTVTQDQDFQPQGFCDWPKNEMVSELNAVIGNEDNYRVDDDADYEYYLNYLEAKQPLIDKINAILRKYISAFKGEKYEK